MRFDFTGLGESGGSFAQTTISHDVRDLVRAATTLIERGYGPCAMVGHSLGGAATLLAASRLKTVRSVAVIGTPASPDHIRGLSADGEEQTRAEGTAEEVFAAAAQPKGFVPLVHADHLVSSRTVADTLAEVLISWLDQTLAKPACCAGLRIGDPWELLGR